MPAVRFSVKWPDGEDVIYYSPSTIIHDYIKPSSTIALQPFLKQVNTALDAASERVFQRYGYHCSSAADEQKKIQVKAQQLAKQNISGDIYYDIVAM